MSELAVGSLAGLAANSYVIDVASGSQLTQPGMVLQVVSAATSTTTTTTSTSYVDFAGLSASITPSSTDNDILVLVTFETSNNTATSNFAQIYRDATTIGFERIVGCTDSGFRFTGAMQTFDSPSSTSSVTYSVDVKVASGTGSFLSGTITLMEIAG